MIRNLIFDLGGVIIFLDPEKAERRFKEVGLDEVCKSLNIYSQGGLFGELERGKINAEEFCHQLNLTPEQAMYAWMGYLKEVFQPGLDMMQQLHEKYNIFILSNTNEVLMSWAHSDDFAPSHHSIDYYVDKVYTSYELKDYKPDATIFQKMLADSGIIPEESLFIDDAKRNTDAAERLGFHTLLTETNTDWRESLQKKLMELEK